MANSVDAAVSKEGLTIPLIDFSKFASGSPSERQQTAEDILKGFQTAGFIYLKNHPIAQATLKNTFAHSKDFFGQTLEAKDKLKWTTPQANRGYSGQGREKVTVKDAGDASSLRAAAPDLKESFEIGRDDDPEHANNWPAPEGAMANWKAGMMDFFSQCKALHIEVMRAIAVGMELGETYFDKFVDVGDNTLRLLHYPAVKSDVFKVNPGTVRAGEHSDYGSITLLFQDSRGGLQVRGPNGHFIDATPIEGTVVVNAGDLLARWSNDTIKSTIHRVVEPPSVAETHPPRYSIAYFCNPNLKDTIDALPGTYKVEADKKYAPITSGDYLVKRLTETY